MVAQRILLIILLIFSKNLAGQNFAFDLPEGRKTLSANFENFDNMVVLQFMLEDSIPIKLILDSGIEGIILTDPALVNYYESACIRNFKLTAPGTSTSLEACYTSLVKLRYKSMQSISSNLILLKEDQFSLDAFIGTKVHGLIGLDKFRNLVVTINYDINTLRFTRPENYKLPMHADVIPINILRGRPYMTARLELDTKEIRDLWLMIDSGANHPILLETDSTDTYQPLKSLETTIGRGLGGIISGAFVRSGWLLIGNSRLDNIITSISSEYIGGTQATRNFRHGTLGSAALSRFRVSFDYTNNRLILTRGRKFKEPFEYNMSGITFESLTVGFNIFKVSEVIKESPAQQAGVKQGDILMSVNQKPAFSLNLGELNAIVSSRPGTPVTLVISRDGRLMTFKFKLKRLI